MLKRMPHFFMDATGSQSLSLTPDLQQSEFPAYWQAQPKFGNANFFMDDIHQK